MGPSGSVKTTLLNIIGGIDRIDAGELMVAGARALVADPKIMVCDEPTGDLDRQMAQEILDLLLSVNREQGKTIVMVTHDPRTAGCATRQLHLDKGRLFDAASGVAA